MTEPDEPSVIANRYRVTRVLGKGGMGAVYEAVQLQLNREVAVKLMLPEFGKNADARARFEREARVSAALRHPHAVEVFDFGEHEGSLYLVMEKLVGVSMEELVGPGLPPMPLSRTLEIGAQVASALVAAHAIQLVHRDLKPANVFLEKDRLGADRAVVVDFGLAFIADREDAERMTQVGIITGTPAYMSPEQIGDAEIAPSSDIYSLGCVLYEMITGATPFDGKTGVLMSKHLFEAAIAPSERCGDSYVPRGLDELILRMLAKPADYRPSAAQVEDGLRAIGASLGERERSRGSEFLGSRAGRMVEARDAAPQVTGRVTVDVEAPEAGPVPVAIAPDGAVVAVAGPLRDELRLGLLTNGIHPVVIGRPELPEGAVVVYVPASEPHALAAMLPMGLPVITDADVSDPDLVQRLMSMGVVDVLPQPVQVAQLAKKIRRAARRSRRRRSQ